VAGFNIYLEKWDDSPFYPPPSVTQLRVLP